MATLTLRGTMVRWRVAQVYDFARQMATLDLVLWRFVALAQHHAGLPLTTLHPPHDADASAAASPSPPSPSPPSPPPPSVAEAGGGGEDDVRLEPDGGEEQEEAEGPLGPGPAPRPRGCGYVNSDLVVGWGAEVGGRSRR